MELEITASLSGRKVRRRITARKISSQRIVVPAAAANLMVESSGFDKITQAIFYNEDWQSGEMSVSLEIEGVSGAVTGKIGCAMFPGVVPGTITVTNDENDALTMRVVLAGE